MFTVGNERENMQSLNDRLASYLETVHSLEQANSKLELQIHEFLENRAPDVNDYSRYNSILEDLRKQVLEMISGNENLTIRINQLHFESEDFQMKVEMETKSRHLAESDTMAFRTVLDSINVTRMKLESDVEALQEELIFLKKNHEEEVLELHIQIDQSGVRVDVDAPRGEDLGQIMGEISAKFEKMALKNQEELKACHVLKMSEVEAEVTENTTAVQGARTERKEKHRLLQSLEIDIQTHRSQKGLLEGTLQDTDLRYNMVMQKHNNIILQLEAELTQLRTSTQEQSQEYNILLSLKMKLEAEIATYRRLLDGGDFKLEDAME
ncbi:hypothetical protein SKAU_G00099660 [Synaphobranchus kaupii]|uniref:IF rod domain-containing protein n=1 Tax=Synaphobranchus kaupii TaxID=118154 RepID=A0A9Q1FY48_SYNKA|nr:hypothetical protein SKAU_G00099660 [Synaphobranchus kaupii]